MFITFIVIVINKLITHQLLYISTSMALKHTAYSYCMYDKYIDKNFYN